MRLIPLSSFPSRATALGEGEEQTLSHHAVTLAQFHQQRREPLGAEGG
jgi:hypothetical protein